jgi:hypothetical protein
MGYWDNMDMKDMVGEVFTEVVNYGNEVRFIREDGKYYRMYHEQDCCESVTVDDIDGDLGDLIGTPILKSEEVSNDAPRPSEGYIINDSYTWTFYKLATINGYVIIKWLGTSNGYYSESVSLQKVGFDEK